MSASKVRSRSPSAVTPLEPAPAGEAPQPEARLRDVDIIVGVAGAPCVPPAEVTAGVAEPLRRELPGRTARVVVLGDGPRALATGGQAATRVAAGTVFSGGFLGHESALPELLEAAQGAGALACAVVGWRPPGSGTDWVRSLLEPVLSGGFDFVCPAYRRGKLDGGINTAIVYPLTRALFGRRLRQPLGGELALSRRLTDQLLRDTEWRTDPLHAGADIWLVTKVLSRELRICQPFLGPRPEQLRTLDVELSETLARVVGLLFHEMERHADVWQRVSGSEDVPTFGDPTPLDDGPAISVARMVEAFELGYRDLRPIWDAILPPVDMLALKRVSGQPAAAFRLDDVLWARIVYGFALAFHAGVGPEGPLLRALTPLYLAWLASFVNEASTLAGREVDARIERLCSVFERQKGYLISGWRWPDRFVP